MNSVRTALCAGVLMAAAAAATEAPQAWRVVPLERDSAPMLPLPPLALVTSTDRSGQTWQQCGEMSGTVEGASKEFCQAFKANGWQVFKRITMGRLTGRTELLIVTKMKQRVLFMVWEKEVGTCGFAWGKEN